MLASPLKLSRLRLSSSTSVDLGLALAFVLLTCLYVMASTGEVARAESAPGDKAAVKILNLLHTDQERKRNLVDALWAGVNAALYNISYRTSSGRKIEFVNISQSEFSDLTKAIETRLKKKDGLLAILGPYSNNDLAHVLESDIVKESGLVCLSPFSSAIKSRDWSPNAFFTRADPRAGIVLLCKYILQMLLVRRVGIMYLTGGVYGEFESNLTTKILKHSDPDISIAFYTQPSASDFKESAFMEFASQKPQAIFVFGETSKHTDEFLKRCLTTEGTADVVLLGTLMQQVTLTEVYARLAKEKLITPLNGKVITSGSNLLATDMVYHHVQVFREQMTLYNATGNHSMNFSDANREEFERRFTEAEFMLSGWIAGSVIARVLFYDTWVKDPKIFQKNIFSQNRFVIHDDFVMGDYGGTCSSLVADQGAMCECNQGGHSVFLKQYFENNTMGNVEDFNYTYSVTDCFPNEESITMSSVSAVVPRIGEVSSLSRISDTFVAVGEILRKYSLRYLKLTFMITVKSLDTSLSDFVEDVANYTNNYRVNIFAGPTTPEMPKSALMIDPFFKRPRLNAFSRDDIVEIVPILEQQFFVLMTYLLDGSASHIVESTELTVVARGLTPDESQAILDVVDKTAVTLGYTTPKKLSMSDADTLTSGIAANGYTLLVGLDEADVQRLADHLRANPAACVVLSYQDFSLYYDTIVSVFKREDATVQARLLTTTNLPLWNDYSPDAHYDSETLAEFHYIIKDKRYHTPIGFESFIIGNMLFNLMTQPGVKVDLLGRLYAEKMITLDSDLQLGPYNELCSYTPLGDLISCKITKNYGARDIYVLSMKRVFDASVQNDYSPITPKVLFTVPQGPHNPLSARTIVAIAVGCSVALILSLCLLWIFCSDGRNNSNAPKDVRQPVTLIFTDIQGSTALWATLPQLMPHAVAMHHKLIRRTIAKHKCYEVKTVGDSFMIACKDAYAAVQVACEIQHLLLGYEWGTSELDGAYREFEMRRRDEDANYKPPTAMLISDEYGALWNGLRVRIGIHTGMSDIRYDEVTKGVDYYGETSNIAARTEAIGNGGQILLTESVWWSLSHYERASLQCESLGSQKLRDVPYRVEVYQLNSVPGRQYTGLRTEFEDRPVTTSNDTGSILSSAGTVVGPAAAIAAVLTNCFSPFSVVQRVKGLQPLLQKWNITIPQRSSRITDEDYCRGIINRLAIKMASVAEMRQRLAKVDVDALPFNVGRHDTDTSSDGVTASPVVQSQYSPPTADNTNLNPLHPRSSTESQKQEQRVIWMHYDDHTRARDADDTVDNTFPRNHGSAQGGSLRDCHAGNDSVISIQIQMPLAFREAE